MVDFAGPVTYVIDIKSLDYVYKYIKFACIIIIMSLSEESLFM